jgi:rare lipoprotein A
MASWYGLEEEGRATASGEPMDPERFTAAHKTLPFGTLIRVTDLDTDRSVMVVVNDRGPFVDGRIVDLSYGAAKALGMARRGVAPVRLEVMEVDRSRLATRWRVQAGSFQNHETANQLARALRGGGYEPVQISTFQKGGRVFYRVWVGDFTERSDAERLAGSLRRDGRDAFVVQTPLETSR